MSRWGFLRPLSSPCSRISSASVAGIRHVLGKIISAYLECPLLLCWTTSRDPRVCIRLGPWLPLQDDFGVFSDVFYEDNLALISLIVELIVSFIRSFNRL